MKWEWKKLLANCLTKMKGQDTVIWKRIIFQSQKKNQLDSRTLVTWKERGHILSVKGSIGSTGITEKEERQLSQMKYT